MISRGRATHSDRLERWLGAECVKSISHNFGKFYWPVPLHGVPGNVFVMPGGDFAGDIKAGSFLTKHDGAALTIQKIKKRVDAKVRRDKAMMSLADLLHAESRQHASIGAFASVDAVIAAWKAGKGNTLRFSKTGVTGIVGNASDLWYRSGYPAAGAAGSAAPGGKAWSAADTGALPFQNRGSANSGHYLNWALNSSVVGNSLLLYDRLFSVDCGAALTTATSTSVSGTPTRYTPDAAAAGNFTYPVATSVLAATAHSWISNDSTHATGMVIIADSGDMQFFNVAGISACPSGVIDLAAGQSSWFVPFDTGFLGYKNLGAWYPLKLDCSVAVATGAVDWVIAHPIAVNACPIANIACLDDGLYTSFSLTSILDDACLSFIELPKPSTNATTYAGVVRTVGE